MAMPRAERLAAIVETTTLTKISSSTALTTALLNSPSWKSDHRRGERRRSLRCAQREQQPRLRSREAQQARRERGREDLAAEARDDEQRGEAQRFRFAITAGLRISPTDTRKTGMNTAPPKNAMRSISWPSFGTSRYPARSPAKNAPTMPSIPNSSATVAAARNDVIATT